MKIGHSKAKDNIKLIPAVLKKIYTTSVPILFWRTKLVLPATIVSEWS
jgi:hypothetical protein